MSVLAGNVVGSRYRLERPLASGGMGHVWIATHLTLDIEVAVKFMADDLFETPGAGARFEREAKAVARLVSPHVVRVYDYGVENGKPYIAMELLVGESLEQRLRQRTRLSLRETADLLSQLAKGLGAAHELGIVHRDLKPGNIFLTRSGGEEVVKVLDFGIAKETGQRIVEGDTSVGAVVGSPNHMSPEQARGGDVDERSDLWSLAVVLFRCLTGHRLFAGSNLGDVIARICADDIPKPSAFAPALGADVDAFFEKGLARNPALRFQSAQEMALALERVVGSSGVLAEAPVSAPVSSVTPRVEETRRLPVIEAPTRVDAVPPMRALWPNSEIESTHVGTTADGVRPARSSRSRVALPLMAAAVALGAGAWFVVPREQGTSPAAGEAPQNSRATPAVDRSAASSAARAPTVPPPDPAVSPAASASEAPSTSASPAKRGGFRPPVRKPVPNAAPSVHGAPARTAAPPPPTPTRDIFN